MIAFTEPIKIKILKINRAFHAKVKFPDRVETHRLSCDYAEALCLVEKKWPHRWEITEPLL